MFRFGDPGGRIYGSASFFPSWWVNSTAYSNIVLSTGRINGSCIRIPRSNSTSLIKTLDNQVTWGIAFAFKTSTIPGNVNGIIGLQDAGTAQVDLVLNIDGTLSLRRGTTILGTSTYAITAGVWNHLEIKFIISSSAGTAELKVNGTTKIGPLTSQNTRNTSNSYANQVVLGMSPGPWDGSILYDYDDIIVYDGQTTDPSGNADIHDFIGDCHLNWLLPTGAGNYTQFTPDSSTNYSRVNESTPDDDTSYVQSSTVNNKDTYSLADLPAGTTLVKSMALCHYAEKTDAGARQLGALIRTASTDFTHPTLVDVSTSYQYSFNNWGINPQSTSNWTVSDINALEIGQTVSS